MKPVIKRLPQGLFSPPSDYRVRLFYILAVGGIAISLLTIAMSIVTNMWATALLAAVLLFSRSGLSSTPRGPAGSRRRTFSPLP